MKMDMFGASGEAIAAALMSAAVLLGVAVGSAPTAALASSTGDTESVLGSPVWSAMTGAAMEPSIPRGALILAQLAGPDEVRVGDILTVRLASGLVTRRVIASDAIDAGRLLTLQADASAAPEDVGVMFTDHATVVRAYVPFAGYATEIAGRWGRGLLGLAGIALLGLAVVARWRMRKPGLIAADIAAVPIPSGT